MIGVDRGEGGGEGMCNIVGYAMQRRLSVELLNKKLRLYEQGYMGNDLTWLVSANNQILFQSDNSI